MNTKDVSALALSMALVIGFGGKVAAAADQTLGMALMSAVIDPDGKLAEDSGAVSSTKDVHHNYTVKFNRSLEHCVAIVTPQVAGYFGNAYVDGLKRTVRADIRRNGSSVPMTSWFYLLVFCPR